MPPAFLITAYKYPDQLGRLVGRIKSELPGAPVFIHIDRKVSIEPFREACSGTRAVFLDDDRVKVTWAAFSMVRATIALLERGLPSGAEHLVLMSEQCYPVRPLTELAAHLDARPGAEFIDVRDVVTEWPAAAVRYTEYSFPDWRVRAPRRWYAVKRVLNAVLGPRTPPNAVKVYAGATWWALSKDGAAAVIAQHRKNRKLRRFFTFTNVPEEMYVHTLLMNCRPPRTIMPSLTYDRFDKTISVSNPVIWTEGDLPELLAADFFLARKFDMTVDSLILDRLDELTAG